MTQQSIEQLSAPKNPEQLNLETTTMLGKIAGQLVNSPDVEPRDGVALDSTGEEVDDPADATAVGTVSHRVVSVSGVPTGIRVANFRETPTGLHIPDSYVATTIHLSEPLSPSNKSELPVRITAVERVLEDGGKQPIGSSAEYVEESEGAQTTKPMSLDEESRTLMSVAFQLQKIS